MYFEIIDVTRDPDGFNAPTITLRRTDGIAGELIIKGSHLQTLEPLEADKVLDIIIAWPPK